METLRRDPWRVVALGAIALLTTGAGKSRQQTRTDAVRQAIWNGLSFEARVQLTAGGNTSSVKPRQVENAAKATKDAVSECVLAATRKLGPVSGSLNFRVQFDPTGEVARCEAEDPANPELTRCLEQAVAEIRLKSVSAPARVRLTLHVDATHVAPVVKAALEDAAEEAEQNRFRVALEWPVKDSKVTSKFGRRPDPMGNRVKFHGGVDLKASMYQPVLAAAAGTVISAGWKSTGSGIQVVLLHNHGLTTSYGHLFQTAVAEGQHVAAGQTIGQAGMTGMITWPHLHFEVAIGDKKYDPMRFLGKVVDLRSLTSAPIRKRARDKRARSGN